ncbi:ABC transporter substrate-binding protein [Microtetraspora fusca]|uniref:ABC transporter substrate-binding protein n=1 Tax=Microtetraspora fusca TaxID=1997 RepID=A0ABW6VAG5_MICFU
MRPITPRPSVATPSLDRRSFLRRSAFAVAAAAAGPTLLSACGSDSAAGAGSGSGSGSRGITFLSYLPLETLSLAPELLAVAGGHFTKHGLDVKLQPVKGSPQAMQTLLAGSGLVTRVGQIDLVTAVGKTEQPMVNVGSLTRASTVRILYSKKNPLNRPEDLAGKTMGVPSEGGTSDKLVSLVMSNSGLDATSVKRQVVGLTPGTFNLVQQGRIAGYVVSLDTANIVVSQNSDAAIFDPGEYVNADTQVYVSTRDNVKNKAADLKAFLAGINDAVAAMVADESLDETLKVLRGAYSFATLNDVDIAKASLRQSRDAWTGGRPGDPFLVTDEKGWSTGYDELVKAGMVPSGLDPKVWLDNSLLSA